MPSQRRRPRAAFPLRAVVASMLSLAAVGGWFLNGSEARAQDTNASRYPDAAEVFQCAFDETADPNFDGWPGGWTRRRGPGFPHFVAARIADDPTPDGNPCLRIDLDGGAAAVLSPPVEVEPQASYVLEVQVQTEGLVNDQAFCTLIWLDSAHQVVAETEGVRVQHASDWQRLRLGPMAPPDRRVRFAMVALCVEPAEHLPQDLTGTIRFDDVWLARLPRIEVGSGRAQNVFIDPAEVELSCRVSGVSESVSQVQFELFDIENQRIGQARYSLAGSGSGEADRGHIRQTRTASERTIHWQPELKENGYYRVQVRLGSAESTVHERALSLVVVDPARPAIGGEFGWSLPRGPEPLDYPELAPLLGHAAISWAKFPVWLADDRLDELSWFTDRLSALGIQGVGLLGEPPPAVRLKLQLPNHASAADLFTPPPEQNLLGAETPTNWFAMLEPTLVRLSLRVRWWQLGFDDDVSFFGYPKLDAKVRQIKEAFDQIGQDAGMGLGWSWLYEPPESANPPWRFLAMSADPPLTPVELAHYLEATRDRGFERWVVVGTLDPQHYSTAERAADLARRLVAAKAHGAEKIFLPDPFDPVQGVMQPDGSPGELFLPWRTLAGALAGTTYLGELMMPSGAQNHVFSRDGETLMVVWHREPAEELLHLRAGATQVDLWGRKRPIQRRGDESVVQVGTLPTIITGLDEIVARLQLDLTLDKSQLINVPDLPQRVQFSLESTIEQGASGRVRVSAPEGWRVRPEVVDLSLAAGEPLTRPLDFILGFDAETGRKLLKFEFDISADRRYQFAVYRWLEVGLGDVSIELSTQMNEYGELEVEQRLVNQGTSDVSYNCDLFVPDRRRQRIQIIRQPPGQSVRVFRVRDGQAILGKTLVLRAQEINGRRVLNYRIEARP